MPEAAAKPHTLRASVTHAASVPELADLLGAERRRLSEAALHQPGIRAAGGGARVCRALSEACDLVIQQLLLLALPEETPAREATRPKISVVATGGYGRRELCPFSDIDVTFIVAEEEGPLLDETVRKMFLSLMELFTQRLGLKVGYAYRAVADVSQLDHQTQTALLDTRVVAGSHGLKDRFLMEVFRNIWPAAFVRQKLAERLALCERHGGTVFRIEPEIKEGPGGLRDIHLAEWLSSVSFPSTRGDVWAQLQRLGVVSRRDVQQLSAARDFLLTVRTWMHWQAGRAADQLIRERQEGVASALKFADDDDASQVERFMEQFYEHAQNVQQVTGFVLERCLAERLSISDELAASGTELHPAYPWLFVASPRFLVHVCQQYQEHSLLPGYDLRRMIAQTIDSCPDLSGEPEAADDFVGLLRAPAPAAPRQGCPEARLAGARAPRGKPGVHDTLALMAELRILQRLIPELGTAFRRVPFDLVHRLTIGFHSLESVRSLERLRTTEESSLQEFRRIWAGIQAPEVLFLAALLHDVGKVASPRVSHSEAGAQIAGAVCRRLQMDAAAAQHVETLVRYHLLMSETAQMRDLTQDKTIQDFVQVIDSVEMLNMLLLLTYADMEATGVLSSMKIRFLEDLYFRAEPVLSGAAPAHAEPEDRARRFRSRISRHLSSTNLTPQQIREHTEGMPVSYLLNTRPDQIALHIRMMETLRSNGPVVEFDSEAGSDISMVHICTVERPEPGLLSQIAGVLYAHDVAVHGAQVFTRDSVPPVALDTLWTDFHGRPIPPLKRFELEQDLVATLKGGPVEEVLNRCRKRLAAPAAPRKVRFDNAAAERHTVVEIKVDDQPGLLYRITRAMAALGWNIESARISTRGDEARDAFYVTGPDGHKLEDEEARLAEAFLAEFAR